MNRTACDRALLPEPQQRAALLVAGWPQFEGIAGGVGLESGALGDGVEPGSQLAQDAVRIVGRAGCARPAPDPCPPPKPLAASRGSASSAASSCRAPSTPGSGRRGRQLAGAAVPALEPVLGEHGQLVARRMAAQAGEFEQLPGRPAADQHDRADPLGEQRRPLRARPGREPRPRACGRWPTACRRSRVRPARCAGWRGPRPVPRVRQGRRLRELRGHRELGDIAGERGHCRRAGVGEHENECARRAEPGRRRRDRRGAAHAGQGLRLAADPGRVVDRRAAAVRCEPGPGLPTEATSTPRSRSASAVRSARPLTPEALNTSTGPSRSAGSAAGRGAGPRRQRRRRRTARRGWLAAPCPAVATGLQRRQPRLAAATSASSPTTATQPPRAGTRAARIAQQQGRRPPQRRDSPRLHCARRVAICSLDRPSQPAGGARPLALDAAAAAAA